MATDRLTYVFFITDHHTKNNVHPYRTMSGAKRKRDNGGFDSMKGNARKHIKAGHVIPRPMPFKPGKNRTEGFYGRFNKPGGELKFLDTAISVAPIDSTYEVIQNCLNVIPQGATESQRIGRKVVVKSIQMRHICTYVPAADTQGSTGIVVCLVLDKQANGAAPGITDIFTTNSAVTAMINLANSERFVVLKRFAFTMAAQAGVQGAFARADYLIDYYKKLDIPLEFDQTSGALTTVKSNNLLLVAGSTGLDDVVLLSGTTRIRYADQ